MPNAIDLMLDYHQRTEHYPGAVVHIERAGDVLSRQVSGRHGPGPDDLPMTEQARFRIASLTKPMVSLVALRLVDRQLMALDTPVAAILPELADLSVFNMAGSQGQPNVHHLLTHTAGFMYAPEIRPEPLRAAAMEAGLARLSGMSRATFLEALSALPLVARPGARFLYGYSTDVLGLMIERLLDLDLEQAMSELLFEPLGMTNTGFRASVQEHAAMPRASESDSGWQQFYAGFEAVERALAQHQATDSAAAPLLSGGGGLISTLDDVVRFARALSNRTELGNTTLLSPALFDQMVSNQLPDSADGPNGFIGSGWGFGLGGAVRHATGAAAVPAAAGEFTWSGVTGQSLFVDPAARWFAVMLSANTASRVMVRLEFRRAAALI